MWCTPASRTVGALAGVLFALMLPGTAAAHGQQGGADTDYRVTITRQPDIPGVKVRVVEAGARLELRNTGQRSIEILGYSREPYAEVRPDGVYINGNSPATYLNDATDPNASVPETASPAMAPQWKKASKEPVIRWHDHRAGWMNAQPPATVAADPGRDRKVLDWNLPLRSGTAIHTVSGRVDWIAPPTTSTWWAAVLLLAGGAFALAFKAPEQRVTACLVATLGAAALADAVGRSVTFADVDTGWIGALVAGQAWPGLAGLAGMAAACYALARAPAADLALGIAAAALALLSGLSHVTSLSHAITPTPWSGDVSRIMTVAALGIGAGTAIGVIARLRGPQAPRSRVTLGPVALRYVAPRRSHT